MGTPVVSDGFNNPGDYIFFTHNIVEGNEEFGSFSMLTSDNGLILWSEIAGDNENDPNPADLRVDTLRLTYGPLACSHEPLEGRFPGGQSNDNDVCVWSTSDNGGRGPNGYTRAFQLPRLFESAFSGMLKTFFLKQNRWNAVAPPVLSNDGLDLIFGVRANGLRAWTNFQDFDRIGNININLTPDTNDARARKYNVHHIDPSCQPF